MIYSLIDEVFIYYLLLSTKYVVAFLAISIPIYLILKLSTYFLVKR